MKRSDPVGTVKRAWRLPALQRQIGRLDRCLLQLEEQSARLVKWRLISFALLFVAGAAILLTWGPIPWVAVCLFLLTIFIILVRKHRQVESTAARFRIWRQLKQDQLARMTLDWDGIPASEPVDARKSHPFGRDLDIVGERSIQRVIDLSMTAEGSDQLRQWLLEFEPDVRQLPARQELVRELTRLPSLVTRLSLNALLATGHDGSQPYERWSSAQLLSWLGERSGGDTVRKALIILLALVPVNFALFLAFLQGWLPPLFLISWFIYGAIAVSQLRVVEPAFRDAAAIVDSLRQLEAVFSCLIDRSFSRFPSLRELQSSLHEEGANLADLFAHTNRLLMAAGLRYNPIVALLINAVFPLDIFVAYRLDALKDDLELLVPGWLAVWHELEALGSLANFAYLYPEASYPQIIFEDKEHDLADTVPLAAKDLGHPLIEPADRICNDFEVDHLGELALITGSNMAGKSTFLRTVGINVRLALSGAPVLATDLVTIPFRVFASITVTDSVTDGFSFFYAEVRRLKELLDYLQEQEGTPVFFLIDEIFRGTNNRERLIGSRSYLGSLVGENGCGAIATHDLELVNLAQDNPAISNFHFRDDVRDGRMVFDYTLHQGPCPTTNALRIMRLAGLPVEHFEDNALGV